MYGIESDVCKFIADGGYGRIVYVPSSSLAKLISLIEKRCHCEVATNESEATGLAIGYHLAGIKPILLCQSDGVAVMLNTLCSTCLPYGIDLLVLVDVRGGPEEENPVHIPFGQGLPSVLDALGFPYLEVRKSADFEGFVLKHASKPRQTPFFLLIYPSALTKPEKKNPRDVLQNPDTGDTTIDALKKMFPSSKFVSSLGLTSRLLHGGWDDKHNFYVLGSMGDSLGIANAISKTNSRKTVCVVGDGELLAGLGTLAKIAIDKSNLLVVVLDNECHLSTGGQNTLTAEGLRFDLVANAVGIKHTKMLDGVGQLNAELNIIRKSREPALIVIKAQRCVPSYPRIRMCPNEIKHRFMKGFENSPINGDKG